MSNKKIKILGIDPGSRKSGYGLVDYDGKNFYYLNSETAKFDTKKEFLLRVSEIYNRTLDIVQNYSPDVIAVESLIYVKSPTALIKLAQTRGIILSALIESGYEGKIFEYSPNFIKAQTIGHGHGDKLAGQRFLKNFLGIDKFSTDDESDALLIAICHGFNQNRSIVKNKKSSGGLAASLGHLVGKEL